MKVLKIVSLVVGIIGGLAAITAHFVDMKNKEKYYKIAGKSAGEAYAKYKDNIIEA